MATNKRRAAAERGKIRYHGGPCRKCGGTERYTSSGACVHCVNEQAKAYREEIREMMERASEGQS